MKSISIIAQIYSHYDPNAAIILGDRRQISPTARAEKERALLWTQSLGSSYTLRDKSY